ncbi:four helix bundle protein [Epilithonimonas xixisoli]|uniref:Four helix bundle protein n=1 Tax=Epilithonimonas xixisoli TaxID=1476462 RepID=A0A4R8IH38_9FLAO|nr:four helix bundle protein [Epilithonimonas xixisoli]TDX84804.1 four helix bundle protein [Epilithonimonas xixisoli]
MAHFKELIVWQKSINLVTEIYRITEKFPSNEIYGLTSQLRRASVSVPSNIAEGNTRRSKADYIQFLRIARGSCSEIETQIIISKNLGFIDNTIFETLSFNIIEISKMINGLINSLKDSNPTT